MRCPLLALSGHDVLRCTCLLLTQSGHSAPVVYRGLRSDAAQTFQFALPNLCFQSLITPGGNSRLPTPVRRQASGHISSKE